MAAVERQWAPGAVDDGWIGPKLDDAELRRLDTICDLGARYGREEDLKTNPKLTPIESWAWRLGVRETDHMREFAGAAN